MKHMWVVAALVCVMLVSAAWAQDLQYVITPRSLGMGGTAIGVANDGAAWAQNPAGLGALNKVPVQMNKDWGYDAIGFYGRVRNSSDEDVFGGTVSGWNPNKGYGWGAGIVDFQDMLTAFGGGAGMSFGTSGWSAGVNFIHNNPDQGETHTMFNLGAMYQAPQPTRAPIRIGVVVSDVTSETADGPYYHAGVLWPVTTELNVTADVLDLSGKTANGPYYNFGAEYRLGLQSRWALRAGLMDDGSGHNLTLGGGYRLPSATNNMRVDVGWADQDHGSFWLAGVGLNF